MAEQAPAVSRHDTGTDETGRMRHAGLPLGSFIEPFLTASGLKQQTREDYVRYLREFDVFTGGLDLRTALTLENGMRFRERLRERGLWSAKNGTMVLKSFAGWVARTRVLAREDGGNILDRLKGPRIPRSKRVGLTEEELNAIWLALAARSQRERLRTIAVLRLMLATGLRRDEIRLLRWKDFELDPEGTRGWLNASATRAGPPIRLDAETAAALVRYNEEERPDYSGAARAAPLFLTEAGTLMTRNGFGTWLDRIKRDIHKATGIRWSAEVMRRTWREETKAPFRDRELRSRCMEILNGQGNYEQAVTVACQVLETRVRDLTSPPPSERSGVRLMKFAFGKPAQLRLSRDEGEQAGALEMFTGFMTYYRNPSVHRLRADLDKAEVFRLVSWVDHLLTVIGRAERNHNGTARTA